MKQIVFAVAFAVALAGSLLLMPAQAEMQSILEQATWWEKPAAPAPLSTYSGAWGYEGLFSFWNSAAGAGARPAAGTAMGPVDWEGYLMDLGFKKAR